LQENQFFPATRQLLGPQHLIGILPTEAIRRVDQDDFQVPGGRQVANGFQIRPQ
jgi:hypothetical protein